MTLRWSNSWDLTKSHLISPEPTVLEQLIMVIVGNFCRGKYMSLFQPLVAGKVLENCGRVIVNHKNCLIFKNLCAAVNTFWKKEDQKSKFPKEFWP